MDHDNLILIGMPGVGKSTVGVLLAKVLSKAFVDTDVVIQAREGRRLQELIEELGTDAFRKLEATHVLSLRPVSSVVATGGSVVYGEDAMCHLRTRGVVVWLDLPVALLARRLNDLGTRGIVRAPGQSLDALLRERRPLYQQYADCRVDCAGLDHDATVAAIERRIAGLG